MLTLAICFFTLSGQCSKKDSLESILQQDNLTFQTEFDTRLNLIRAHFGRGPVADSLVHLAINSAHREGEFYLEAKARILYSNMLMVKDSVSEYYRKNLDRIEEIYVKLPDPESPDNVKVHQMVLLGNAIESYFKRDFKEANANYDKVIAWCEKYKIPNKIGKYYSAKGLMLGNDGQYFEAIKNYIKADEYPETVKVTNFQNMSNLYEKIEDWENLSRYADSTIYYIAKRKSGNERGKVVSYLNKTVALNGLGAYQEAIDTIKVVLPLLDDKYFSRHGAKVYTHFLKSHEELELWKDILTYENEIQKFKRQCDFVDTSSKIGNAYLQIGNYNKAIKLCLEGLKSKTKCKEEHSFENNYKCLYNAYKQKGDYKNAVKYFDLYQKDKDRFETVASWKELSAALNQNELKQQEELLKLQQEKKDVAHNERLGKFRVAGFLGLLMLLGAFLFSFILKKRNKRILDQNEQISNALSDKEVLIKEIHHRVKNNLQVISSLLSIQSRTIKNEEAKLAILEGRSRVHSMSLIHQNLYQDDNLTSIEMQTYIPKLVDYLIGTYLVEDKQIETIYNVSSLNLDVETVIPIGLILNELITNSLKYAWPEINSGQLKIDLFETDDTLNLIVSDNGVGLAEDQLSLKKDSFGHSLVRAFRTKLDAEVNVEGESGTMVEVKIRNYKKVV